MKKLILFFVIFSACSTQQKKIGDAPISQDIEFYFLQDKSLPLIEMGLLFREGSSLDPMGQRGITALTINTILENEKVNDQANQDAVNFQSQVSADYLVISADGLSQKKNEVLSSFTKLIFEPAWKKNIFEMKKKKVLQKLRETNDSPELLGDHALKLFLYGSHPYGLPVGGASQDIKKLGIKDVMSFYQYILKTPRPILYVVGDFDEDFKTRVTDSFKNWTSQKNISGYWPKPPPLEQSEIQLYTRKDSKQSKIRFGQFSLKENDADKTKLQLAVNILGGSFTSRLNQRLRLEKSYTYGAQGYLNTRRVGGYLQIDTSTKPESTVEVIKEIIEITKKLYDEGVSEEELGKAKQDMIMDHIRQQETAEGKNWFYLEQRLFDKKIMSLEDKISEIKSLSVSDVNRAIKEHFNVDKYKIVVIGPEKILPELSKIMLVTVKPKLEY